MGAVKLGLDIDDVLANFTKGFMCFAGIKDPWYTIRSYYFEPWLSLLRFNELFEEVKQSKKFWLSLEPMNLYIPSCCSIYLTTREVPDEWTLEWLTKWNYPKLPLVNSNEHGISKVDLLGHMNLNGLVDDQPENYDEAVEKGYHKYSFLVSRPWNRHVATPNKIFDLLELEWMIPKTGQ